MMYESKFRVLFCTGGITPVWSTPQIMKVWSTKFSFGTGGIAPVWSTPQKKVSRGIISGSLEYCVNYWTTI